MAIETLAVSCVSGKLARHFLCQECAVVPSARSARETTSHTHSANSSSASWLRLLCLIVAVLLGMGSPAQAGLLSSRDVEIYREAFRAADSDRWNEARRVAEQASEKFPAKILRWMEISQAGNGASFEEISGFAKNNANWPNMSGLRRQAELAMTDSLSNSEIRAWFSSYTPLTIEGFIRYATALGAEGETTKLTELVRRRWVENAFNANEEQEFRSRYRAMLRSEDHIARLDRLLWDHQSDAARRMYPLVSDGHQALAEARLALISNSGDVESVVDRVPESLRSDPGLLFERMHWRRVKGNDSGATEILLKAPNKLGRPAAWWSDRHLLARRAIERGDYALAYALARRHGQTEGQNQSQAEFLAGWLALRFLDKPSEAFDHFHRLYRAVSSPISRSRGAYWCGRAAEVLGNRQEARKWHTAAAAFGATFYGQLSAARIGQDGQLRLPTDPDISSTESAAFAKRSLAQAAQMLYEIDPADTHDRAALFVRKSGNEAKTPADYVLTARLALSIRRPDLAISISKQAVQNGVYVLAEGYPVLNHANGQPIETPLVLSLIRQESTFNTNIVSGAGARGLMQLMPATAQLVSKKLDLPYALPKLTGDQAYNVRLGSAYMAEMIERFNGSYILAIASYNAGPGRVRSWLDSFGDPRSSKVDPVDWIELIPIYETRNYVQRILEALQVYRHLANDGRSDKTIEQDIRR
ncbi:soluble lytic murein transglycosylase [Azospirillaceae bacterium]